MSVSEKCKKEKIELSKEIKHDIMREGNLCSVIMMLFEQKPKEGMKLYRYVGEELSKYTQNKIYTTL